jgi:hypothetical protein
MEIRGRYTIGSRSSTDKISFTLPGSYAIDTSIAGLSDLSQFGLWTYLDNGFYLTSDSRTGYGIYNGSDSDKIYYASKVESGTSDWETRVGNTEFGDDNRNLTLMMSVPILGWNSKFTPLLSMPLADYSEFQNTYSARVTNTGTTSAITSQSGNFIASSTRTGTNGAINIVWTSGFFTVAPSVVVSVDGVTGNSFAMVSAISSTGCTINADEDGGSNPDRNMNLTVTRQGADYRQVPQATAAIIKPSVCYVKDIKAYNDPGGATGAGNTWHTRTLNI